MTTCLGKSCSFGLPCVPFVNCCQFMYLVIPFGFEGGMWGLIVSVPDHCLSFTFNLDPDMYVITLLVLYISVRKSKNIRIDQELIQSDPTSCPQNLKGNLH